MEGTFPIEVTESGMMTDVKEPQFENECSAILVTESGIVIDVKLHPKNENGPRAMTDVGIVTVVTLKWGRHDTCPRGLLPD